MTPRKKNILGEFMTHRNRDPSTARTKFERWVFQAGGPTAVAKVLGVKPMAVVRWCNRLSTPRLEYAVHIELLSKGALTCSQIFHDTRFKYCWLDEPMVMPTREITLEEMKELYPQVPDCKHPNLTGKVPNEICSCGFEVPF